MVESTVFFLYLDDLAGEILAAVTPVVIALIFQRYIVSGMTAGAVKG